MREGRTAALHGSDAVGILNVSGTSPKILAMAGKGKGFMKVLKPDMLACHEKWGKQARMNKTARGQPGAPWPVMVALTIPQPDDCTNWDIDEIKVKLVVSPDKLEVTCPSKSLPPELLRAMEGWVRDKWEAVIQANGGTANGWRFYETL